MNPLRSSAPTFARLAPLAIAIAAAIETWIGNRKPMIVAAM